MVVELERPGGLLPPFFLVMLKIVLPSSLMMNSYHSWVCYFTQKWKY